MVHMGVVFLTDPTHYLKAWQEPSISSLMFYIPKAPSFQHLNLALKGKKAKGKPTAKWKGKTMLKSRILFSASSIPSQQLGVGKEISAKLSHPFPEGPRLSLTHEQENSSPCCFIAEMLFAGAKRALFSSLESVFWFSQLSLQVFQTLACSLV